MAMAGESFFAMAAALLSRKHFLMREYGGSPRPKQCANSDVGVARHTKL
jgi:hypothetical protein